MDNLEVIETHELETERYGTILFSKVKGKGWTYQYSSDIANDEFDNESEWIPEYLDELGDECFYPNYKEAERNMYADMSNNSIMGIINV